MIRRIHDTESKYYADGEDAYDMQRCFKPSDAVTAGSADATAGSAAGSAAGTSGKPGKPGKRQE